MIRGNVQVWPATAPVDMRRSFDRLAEHVRTILAANPMSGHLFVFRNRCGERVKILWWDQGGFVLFYKRMERGTFQFPSSSQKAVAIDSRQLIKLLSGLPVDIANNAASHR